MRAVAVPAHGNGRVSETGNFAVVGLVVGVHFQRMAGAALIDERQHPFRVRGIGNTVLHVAIKTRGSGAHIVFQEECAMDAFLVFPEFGSMAIAAKSGDLLLTGR